MGSLGYESSLAAQPRIQVDILPAMNGGDSSLYKEGAEVEVRGSSARPAGSVPAQSPQAVSPGWRRTWNLMCGCSLRGNAETRRLVWMPSMRMA